jgi:hypothetical protein
MAEDKLIIRDDTILIDYRLIFQAIREDKGDWESVEKELNDLFASMQLKENK